MSTARGNERGVEWSFLPTATQNFFRSTHPPGSATSDPDERHAHNLITIEDSSFTHDRGGPWGVHHLQMHRKGCDMILVIYVHDLHYAGRRV